MIQVHITQGDRDGRAVIVSWVTSHPSPSEVKYWEAEGHPETEGKHKKVHKHTCKASSSQYKFYTYTSGFIHHATIKDLKVID